MRQMAGGVNVASGFQPGPGCSQKVQAGGRSQPCCPEAGKFAVPNLPSRPEDLAAPVSALITSSFSADTGGDYRSMGQLVAFLAPLEPLGRLRA